jgi:hypothetical protein
MFVKIRIYPEEEHSIFLEEIVTTYRITLLHNFEHHNMTLSFLAQHKRSARANTNIKNIVRKLHTREA